MQITILINILNIRNEKKNYNRKEKVFFFFMMNN